jgi:hypothetical protein
VQNSVELKDIGTASSTVAFFRSLGGTIGVSVLGAVLAHRVTDSITTQLAAAGVVGVLAALLFKPITLRSTSDLTQTAPEAESPTAEPAIPVAAGRR